MGTPSVHPTWVAMSDNFLSILFENTLCFLKVDKNDWYNLMPFIKQINLVVNGKAGYAVIKGTKTKNKDRHYKRFSFWIVSICLR